MKLITLTILLTSLAVDVIAQKFRQDFPFPPQFQTPNVGLFSSDSSLYLPPESHTTHPYFPMKNVNNLQFPLLPPTGTKAPATFPTPFPFMFSSSLVPSFDDDDDDEDSGRIRMLTSPHPPSQRTNQTDKAPEPSKEKREMRPIPKMMYQQPIPMQNRNDIKFPFKFPGPAPMGTTPTPAAPTPATRRMIISTETQRSDLDQVKAPSFIQGPHFLPAGQGIYVSSTTEPAIPILRLSNEMDLDGSFSYEALGADQTHYVQHSRMENMGTDKEEQVVEGSYSYVGDNGQTYTVHYVADANGFRASGDHLPVAPPVPEIIQRAVQYNLAEEAKKPPHLKSWQDDGKDNEVHDTNKNHQFSLPPPRNLFTGRTPEAFSYSFSQGSNTGNNLVTAASNQAPIKTVDFTTEQPKANNGPISPQITFLASQGAHLPSMNTIQNTISRMFTTEKSTMPQIVNYEAQIKEADQEPNKGLWRWQYGINANNLNQNQNKETISRSFGEGDDVMINFSDMNPEQYTKMIRSQFEYSPENSEINQYARNRQSNEGQNNNQYNQISQSNVGQYNNQQPQNFQYIENKNSQYQNNYKQSQLQNNEDQNKYQYVQNALNENRKNNYQYAHNAQNNENSNNYHHNQNIQNNENQNQNIENFQNHEMQNNYYANYYQPQEASTVKESQNVTPKESTIKNEDSQQTPTTVTSYSQSADWSQQSFSIDNDQKARPTTKPESRKLLSDSPKILTQKDFMFPSQTVTQSYDFEENFYEPRKLKALNNEISLKSVTNNVNQVQNIFNKSFSTDSPWDKNSFETKQTTTQEPYITTIGDFKFTDFIVQESKSDFKPIITTTAEAPRQLETTTENIVQNIIQNNLFLKNLFSPNKFEKRDEDENNFQAYQEEKKVFEKSNNVANTETEAEPKTDKISKLVQYQTKPVNDIKVFKKKPVDISEILNYVSMKNHFESSKTKPKGRLVGSNYDHRNEIRFIPIQQERQEPVLNVSEQNNNLKKMNQEQNEELRGLIKNYKVLQRNNNNMKYHNNHLKTELSPPPFKSPSLPPLGRAGPSMKSYLPPIYV